MKDELEIAPWANCISSNSADESIFKVRDELGIIKETKEYYRSRGVVMTKKVTKYYHFDDSVRHRSYDAACESARNKGWIAFSKDDKKEQ